MISPLHIDRSVSTEYEPVPGPLRNSLPLVCPACRQPIALALGLCGHRLIDAILLQAERLGTELECDSCGLRFVFHRSPGNETAPAINLCRSSGDR